MPNLDLKILCVDDEEDILFVYETAIKQSGFTAILCKDPIEAVQAFKAEMNSIIMVIADFKMPAMNGFEFRAAMLPEGLAVPFFIASAFITKEMALSALDLKISQFLAKPFHADALSELIKKEAPSRVEFIRESQILEGTFIEEATAILDEMDPVLLKLDHDRSNQESLNLVFRGAHTIKGSSGVLLSPTITRYVHKYEDIIAGIKSGNIAFSDATYEVLLKGFDRIKELIAAVAGGTIRDFKLDQLLPELTLKSQAKVAEIAHDNPPSQKAANIQKPKDSISVPISMLDTLSGYSGEITVIRNMVNKLIRSLERRYSGNKDIQALGELLDEMHKINSTIQTSITDLRKVPLAGVLKPIPRIVRDLARDLLKSINLAIDGEALRIDSSLATVCSNSLVHLVRNSADHGIESSAERLAAGKAETGTVQIQCSETRDEVIITIADDGHGIDPNKIRAKALEKNLFTEIQLREMTEQQILSIIFASGFSTAAKITDVSGRGVGMDMVRSSVEAVGGSIHIDSALGQGSKFHIHLPIPKSVLIINSLLVEAAGKSYAVPQDSIIRVLRIEPDQYSAMLQAAGSGLVLWSAGQLFPFLNLSHMLGIKSPTLTDHAASRPSMIEVLLLRSESNSFALQVDAISDTEEIAVKPVPSYVNPCQIFEGATFMGDGTVGLILDIKGIAELAGIKSTASPGIQTRSKAAELAPQGSPPPAASFLLFYLSSKAIYGVPLEQVFRLEEIDSSKIQRSGADRVVLYRDEIMPILNFETLLKPSSPRISSPKERIATIVARTRNRFFGLEVSLVVDIARGEVPVSDQIRDHPGVLGNTFIADQNVTILDMTSILADRMIA